MIDYLMSVNPIILASLGGLFTFLVTSLGSMLVFFTKNVSKNFIDASLSFSAGIMVSASYFSLISPAISILENNNVSLIVSLGFISGGLFIFITDKLLSLFLSDSTNKRNILLVSSITIHNIPEGLIVGVAFGYLSYNLNVDTLVSAILLTSGIALQNFPEGASVSLPLRSKYSSFKAFFMGSLSGLVELISAFIGSVLVLRVNGILPFMLCFASGCMIYVSVKELIAESQLNTNKNLMTIIFIIGFTIMMFLDILLS